MKRFFAYTFLISIFSAHADEKNNNSLPLSAFDSGAGIYKRNQKLDIVHNGWICHTLEKAIASREIERSRSLGAIADVQQLMDGSCINYSIRPVTVIGYADYLIPAFPEKGKLFLKIKEPRSGQDWYAFAGFLTPHR